MVKATSRTVHHAFARYLDLAHEGQEIVITRHGRPWARLAPVAPKEGRRVEWPDIVKRARAASGGRKVAAVRALLRMREDERW